MPVEGSFLCCKKAAFSDLDAPILLAEKVALLAARERLFDREDSSYTHCHLDDRVDGKLSK